MPYFSIETNKKINSNNLNKLSKKALKFISKMLGKPEKWVMVSVKNNTPMIFGERDDFSAFIDLKSINLKKENCPEYSIDICDFVQNELRILPENIYINYYNIDKKMFGWNKGVF